MDKREFVEKCGELLNIAKPYLVSCKLVKGSEIKVSELMKQYERYMPDDDYVLVSCENGHTYKICVEANSLAAIAEEIFRSMAHK